MEVVALALIRVLRHTKSELLVLGLKPFHILFSLYVCLFSTGL